MHSSSQRSLIIFFDTFQFKQTTGIHNNLRQKNKTRLCSLRQFSRTHWTLHGSNNQIALVFTALFCCHGAHSSASPLPLSTVSLVGE
jgi:hypothetical protein